MYMIYLIIFTDDDVVKLRMRDPDTFQRVFNEYHQKIYNFLIIKTNGDSFTADEIFSDTFYSALKSSHTIKNPDKVFSWLLLIAKRRFIDHLRKKYKKKESETDEGIDDQTHYKKDQEDDNEKAILLNIALENIKPEYGKLLKLKYIENKSQKEISEILNKTESSIESLLFRAREMLKKEIKKVIKEN
jgi:RNA polymerase sigma factor (sigma-70 family)